MFESVVKELRNRDILPGGRVGLRYAQAGRLGTICSISVVITSCARAPRGFAPLARVARELNPHIPSDSSPYDGRVLVMVTNQAGSLPNGRFVSSARGSSPGL